MPFRLRWVQIEVDGVLLPVDDDTSMASGKWRAAGGRRRKKNEEPSTICEP